ncbi:hypothetical protein F4778DRAFT_786824 [Xylariomycetidae sp. FL2044]|nr:hypothetical protein F4778DRAFT_786824 [Xylariomycetidae sp. FL2044]
MAPFSFIREQYRHLPLTISESTCAGKTYIITGGNCGLGYEAAKHLVEFGARRVIIAVRSVRAGEAAKAEIEASTGRGVRGVLEVWPLDLASWDSVRALAKRARDELDRLDGLIQNAAVALPDWATSEGGGGLETSIVVNVISPLLLAALLMPKLSADARKFQGAGSGSGGGYEPCIVFVSSGSSYHRKDQVEVIRDDMYAGLLQEGKTAGAARYPLSKLANIYAVREFAKRAPIAKYGVLMNLTNPGVCWSKLTRNAPLPIFVAMQIMRFFVARSTEAGSRCVLSGLTAGAESHGKFLGSCEIKPDLPPGWFTPEEDEKLQRNIWEGVAKKLEEIEPGCLDWMH